MKIFKGVVISTKMKNTATVLVDNTFIHRLYGKRLTRSKKYHVHDEYRSSVGDTVNFIASKPYSRMKKWRIVNITDKKGTLPKAQKVSEDTVVRGTLRKSRVTGKKGKTAVVKRIRKRRTNV